MDQEEINKNYADLERRLTKKDYVGNILYFPYEPDEQYFYIIDPVQRVKILDQLNQEFDVQEKLTISKRTQPIEVKFGRDAEPSHCLVFARWTKGCDPVYLSRLCEEYNSDFNGLSVEARDKLYRDLCLTTADKVVAGFDMKHCNKPGGEWIIRCNRNPVSSSKKEMMTPYPKSTTEPESEAEHGELQQGMDTFDMLYPDISMHTASRTSSVEQVQSTSQFDDQAILPSTSEKPSESEGEQFARPAGETTGTARSSESVPAVSHDPPGQMELDPLDVQESIEVQDEPASQDMADQPMVVEEPAQPARKEDRSKSEESSKGKPGASSTPKYQSDKSSRSSSTSRESELMSGSEYSKVLTSTRQQRKEMAEKRADAEARSPLKKVARELEETQKSVYLSDFQKIMATGILQIMKSQDALMGTVGNLLEQERMRQELDDALQEDLEKICHNVKKRERSVATVKKLSQDILAEVKSPKKGFQPKAGSSKVKATPRDTSFADAAAKANKRQTKIQALKQLLKIDAINEHTIELLKSDAYQAYMAEKILFRLSSSTAENVAASLTTIFLNCQFSKRFIAYCYWGDDKRASNINWHSVPLPIPSQQLWNEIAQELCSHDKKLIKRLKASRKQILNDGKKSRNEAFRMSHIDREVAESRLYHDYEDFYNVNRDYKKLSRPNDNPPGEQIHKATIMKQKGVQKQYAYTQQQVVPKPEILASNAGTACTKELVDQCIEALRSLGYGIGATPSELTAEHTDKFRPVIEAQELGSKLTSRGTKKKGYSKKAKEDSEESSDSSSSSTPEDSPPPKKKRKEQQSKKHDDKHKHKSSKKVSKKPDVPSKKKGGHSKKHSSKKREEPSQKRDEPSHSRPKASTSGASPAKKRKPSSSFHGSKDSPAKKSKAAPAQEPELFAKDPNEKITKAKKKVSFSQMPHEVKVIEQQPAEQGSSSDDDTYDSSKSASKKLMQSTTISDVSQSEYAPQGEEKEEDSSDSYESSSGSSSDSSDSGSGSGSSSSSDSEVKVVV